MHGTSLEIYSLVDSLSSESAGVGEELHIYETRQ